MKSTLAVQICTAHSALDSGLSSPLLPTSSISSISSTYLFYLAFM